MNTNLSNAPSERAGAARVRVLRYGLIALAVLAIAGAAYGLWLRDGSEESEVPLASVQRGPLTISVIESGTVQNRERVVVKSQVEGSVQILNLIDEGVTVEKGDLLVELDSSSLQDQRTQQQINVQNAEAAFIRARENLAVTRSQTESDIAQAELNVQFAKLDLKKYLEGEWPRALDSAEAEITIATEEVQRANDKLEWSEKLAAEGYITRTELLADKLAAKRANINLDLANGSLSLLKDYTHQRTLTQLRSDVDQAGKALDRTKRKAAADGVQAEAELKARQSEYERQQAKLAKINEQIEKCRIIAPVSGMVVYATTGRGSWRGNAEPLEEGQTVRERQELIHLPTTSAMMAEVKVHESSLRKVRTGMPVRITVDAMPGQVFWGRVAKIALLPDAQSAFLNPDLKVFNTEVHVVGDGSSLRPGMTCRAEIIVEQYEDALYVPLQSVVRVGGESTVYAQTPRGPRATSVEVGMDNNRVIRIVKGLEEGQSVLLSPPLAPSQAPVSTPARTATVAVPEGVTRSSSRPASSTETPDEKPDGNETPTGLPDMSKLREMTPEQRRTFFRSLTPEQREALRRQGGYQRRRRDREPGDRNRESRRGDRPRRTGDRNDGR